MLEENDFLLSAIVEKLEEASDSVKDAAKILKDMRPSDVAEFKDHAGFCHWFDSMQRQMDEMKKEVLRRCNTDDR